MTTRRDFLRIAGIVGAGVVLMPVAAAAHITPPEPRDDTAWIQSKLDRGEAIPPGLYHVSAPLVLRTNDVIHDSVFRYTRTVPHMIEVAPYQHDIVVRDANFVGHRPSFVERVLRRFAA